MQRAFFQKIETYSNSTEIELGDVIDEMGFDSSGLIPVITQDASSKQVLMLAWMNKEALWNTLNTGEVTYWSRSRKELWIKGATSGHTQELVSLSIDCDGDAILCEVNQIGGACHTNRKHCFYLKADATRHKVQVVNVE